MIRQPTSGCVSGAVAPDGHTTAVEGQTVYERGAQALAERRIEDFCRLNREWMMQLETKLASLEMHVERFIRALE